MLRSCNTTVIGRTVNAKLYFVQDPRQLRPLANLLLGRDKYLYSLQPARQCYRGKLFHPIQ